jgi:integrase
MVLTDAKIKAAKPRERQYKLSDGKGLFLLVKPSGGKLWQMKYRFDGREKLLSFGRYPEISLAIAREKANAAKTELALGNDPAVIKKKEKLARQIALGNTFEAVAKEWIEKRRREGLATITLSKLEWVVSQKLSPVIGEFPISEIKAAQLLLALKKIEDDGLYETANRAKRIAGQIFRYAIATGRAERDPSQDLKGALIAPQVTHRASITDPKELAHLLVAMKNYSGTPVVKAALMLSALLFQRPGEIRTMKWADVDFDNAEWRYFVNKTKIDHIVPLAKQSKHILEQLKPLTGRGAYVLPSARGGGRPLSENGVRIALRTIGYDNGTVTAHGFRATARTILDEVLGYRVDWIEHQLAHKVKDPNGRAYNRTTHLDGRKKMMQDWADYLDSLCS